jgi:uncharacterized SAM-binding protein YcdF (DUF218 family)
VSAPPKLILLRKWLVRVLAAFGAVMLIITFTPLTSWVGHWMSGGFDNPEGDVLIVLSGGGVQDGVLAHDSYLRAEYAARAWRSGHFHQVWITGGGNLPAAPAMRDFMVFEGVPASAITVESNSTSTRENALFSHDALAAMPGSKVLLTSDFHIYRATRVFRRAGIEVQPYPIPDAVKRSNAWFHRPTVLLLEATEVVKIAYYKWRGWM